MRQALAARGMDTQHVVLINNFMLKNFSLDADVEAVSPTSSKQADLQAAKRSKLVFAGNLGRFQGLDDLLDAFLDLDKSKCKLDLHFLGEGAMASILKEKAANAENIFFHGHKPFEEASHFISDCDAGIVSIQPDVYRYAYPSKTLTYLGLGVPVLAVVEPESGMAKDIVKNELGIVSKGRSRQELQAAFMELSQWLKHEQNRSEKVSAWFNENATADAAFARWHQLFNQIAIEDASSKTQPAANHE